MNGLDRIVLNPHLDITLAQQLKQQLNWLIASGQLRAGEKLPSVRQAARRFQINLHTVRSAYQKLESDGLVETRPGAGTIVLPTDSRRIAQIASGGHSHTVGVIIPSITNPFYHPFLQGIESIASLDQTLLFLCVTHDDLALAQRSFAQLASKNVDGILLASHDDSLFRPCAADPDQREPRPAPLVAADWPASQGYAVNLDLENAGRLATRHLLEHGHRRIGLITFALEAANVLPLNRGYQRALQEAGLLSEPDLVQGVLGFNPPAGAAGARALLALAQPPTAIFAITDLLAIGAMQAIQQAGLQVPQDIAIIGFNDIPLAGLTTPRLTSVAAPAYQMGVEAMKMLQTLAAGRRPAHSQITLPTALVVRQSCGCNSHLTRGG